MMWHQHFIALRHVLLEGHDLLLAGLAILDAVCGFSRAIAARLKIMGGAQAVLAWLLLVGFLIFNNLYAPDTAFWRNVDVSELGALGEARMLSDFLDYASNASIVICGLAAWRMQRPVFLWLALGYLGNVGAIVWLLLDRKRTEGFQPDQPRRVAA